MDGLSWFERAPVAKRGGTTSRRIVELFSIWRQRAVERRLLAALDDRGLADIGITRLDAAYECRKPFWRA